MAYSCDSNNKNDYDEDDDDDKCEYFVLILGETLLSPLVLCGPHGLKFRCPVELRLPHWATFEPPEHALDSKKRPRSFALKSGETTSGQLGRPSSWQSVAIDSGGPATSVGSNSVSVLVDHF